MEQNQPVITTRYCVIIIEGKFLSDQKKITIHFGGNEDLINSYDQEVVNATMQIKEIEIHSVVDALNYMADKGWEIEHFIPFPTNTDGGNYETYRYLLKRTAQIIR